MATSESRFVRSNSETRKLASGRVAAKVDSDFDFADPLFDTAELNIIDDLREQLGAEAGRMAGDMILEIKRVEESYAGSWTS